MAVETRDQSVGTKPSASLSAWVLGLLTLIYTFSFVDRQIIGVLAEPIKADLGLTDTEIGLVSGINFALFYSTLGIPVAWLADRHNRVRIVSFCCIVWSVFCASTGLAQNFLQLVLARIGIGIGEAGGTAPSHSILSDFFASGRRGTAQGIFALGPSIGPFVASAVGGGVAALYGWRLAFVAVALPGLLGGILLMISVKEPPRGRLDPGCRNEPSPLSTALARFFNDKVLVLNAAATGMAGVVGYGMLIWSPPFLMRSEGMSMGEIAIYYSIVLGVVSAVGTLVSGWLVDVLGRKNAGAYAYVPALAHLVSLPFFLAALWANSWQWSLALLSVPNLLTSMFLGPAIALVQNRVRPAERALSSAIVISVLNLVGFGIGPLLVGWVSDLATPNYGSRSLAPGLSALAPFFLFAALFYYLAGRRLVEDKRRVPE